MSPRGDRRQKPSSGGAENPRLPVVRKRVATAPAGRGVYRWMNDKGEEMYVGKCKSLKQRLAQTVKSPRKFCEACALEARVIDEDRDAFLTCLGQCPREGFGRIVAGQVQKSVGRQNAILREPVHAELKGHHLERTRPGPPRHPKLNGFEVEEIRR